MLRDISYLMSKTGNKTEMNALFCCVVHAVAFLNKMAPAAAAALLFMLCHG